MQAQFLTTVEPLDAGSLLAGRYRILTKVGEGGFRRHRTRLVSIGHRACSFLIGLLIGSVPYLFLPLIWALSSLNFNASPLSFLMLLMFPVMLLFFLWPGVLICECVAAIFLFVARPRRPWIACGILIMLALIYLAILLGWLPSASNFFS